MSGEVNVIPTLRKSRGGPIDAFWGGAVKKNTLYVFAVIANLAKFPKEVFNVPNSAI